MDRDDRSEAKARRDSIGRNRAGRSSPARTAFRSAVRAPRGRRERANRGRARAIDPRAVGLEAAKRSSFVRPSKRTLLGYRTKSRARSMRFEASLPSQHDAQILLLLLQEPLVGRAQLLRRDSVRDQ